MSYNISKRATTSPAIRAFSTGARGTAAAPVHDRCLEWLQAISSKPTPASPPRQQVVSPVKPASPIRDPEPVPEPRTLPFTTHISLRRPRFPTITAPPSAVQRTLPIDPRRQVTGFASGALIGARDPRPAWRRQLLAYEQARQTSSAKPAPQPAPAAASEPTQPSEPVKPPPTERLSRLGCRPLPEAEHLAALQAARERQSRQDQLGVAKRIAEWEATKAKYLKGPEPAKPSPNPEPRFEPIPEPVFEPTPEPIPEPAFERAPEPASDPAVQPQPELTHDAEPAEEFEAHLQLQDSFERPSQPRDLDRWIALRPNLSTVMEQTEHSRSMATMSSETTETDHFCVSGPSPCAGLSSPAPASLAAGPATYSDIGTETLDIFHTELKRQLAIEKSKPAAMPDSDDGSSARSTAEAEPLRPASPQAPALTASKDLPFPNPDLDSTQAFLEKGRRLQEAIDREIGFPGDEDNCSFSSSLASEPALPNVEAASSRPAAPCPTNIFEGILDDIDVARQRLASQPLPAQTNRPNIFADLDLREEFKLPTVATTMVWTDKPKQQQQQPCTGVLCRFTTKVITMAKAAWAKVKSLVWN